MPTKWDKGYVMDYLKDNLPRYLFLGALPQEIEDGIKNLTGLTTEDIELLKKVHFLISDEVNELVSEIPHLMRNLAHSTQRNVVRTRGIVKGRIDWNYTYKERYAQGFNDKTLFMCRPASKMYDLPENQLLKFILSKVHQFSDNIKFLSKISSENINPDDLRSWGEKIILNDLVVKKTLKHVLFHNITSNQFIRSKSLQRTSNHRNPSYKKVASCYKLYYNLFINKEPEILKSLIQKQILTPLSDDRLFELYVLFKILDNYEPERLKVRLLTYDEKYTAKYELDNKKVFIYYQKSAPGFGSESKYKNIFDAYSLDVSLRLPDIILRIEEDEHDSFILVEVKRTSSRNYTVDSVYKVLGYLNDFEKSFENRKDPKAVLVVWSGIEPTKPDEIFNKEVLILTADEIDKITDLIKGY